QWESHALSRKGLALVGIKAAIPVILLVPAWSVSSRLARRVDAGEGVGVEDIITAADNRLRIQCVRKIHSRTDTFPVWRSDITSASRPFGVTFVNNLAFQPGDIIGACQTEVGSRTVSSLI